MKEKQRTPLIRADFILRKHDEMSVKIYNRNDRATHIVRRELLDTLALFDRPRSPGDAGDESVAELARIGLLRRLPSAAPGSTPTMAQRSGVLTRKLGGWFRARSRAVRAGRLTRRRQVTSSAASTPEPSEINAIVIPSVGRTGEIIRLARALGDVPGISRPAQSDRTAQIHIQIHLDSHDSAASHTLRELLGSDSGAIEYTVSDRSANDTLITGIERSLALDAVERRALRFGLAGDSRFGITTGATRNRTLLANIGSRILSLDDDVMPLGHTAGPSERTRVSTSDELRIHYETGREALLRAFPAEPVDIRRAAGAFLGTHISAGDLEPAGDIRWHADRISPELWRRLEQSRARIELVSFGYLGDSGAGSTPIMPAGEARAPQLFGTEREQELALTGREVLQIAEQPTITNHPYFMSAAFALDLTGTPPPFFPFGRGQDGLFSLMLTRLFDDALIAHLPIALLHDPQDDRADRRSVLPDRVRLGICRIVAIVSGYYAAQIAGGTRNERLVDFGEWLGEFAAGPPSSFRERLTGIVCEALENYAASIERVYGDAAGTSSPLGLTVANLLEDIHRRIATRTITPITEYAAAGAGEEETFELVAGHLAQYAQFARLWPAILEKGPAGPSST